MSFDFKYDYPQIARDSGFKLRQFRDGPLDWRVVGSLEIERIIREQQFEHIDAILFYLSEAPLASMLESNILDSGIAKYFILSQLSIQYLIFCRKFLDETVRTLRGTLVEVEVENVNLKTVNQEHSNEILQLHKKISQIEAINDIVFPCHMCTKNFVSNDALNIHLSKKHSKSPTNDSQGKDNDRTLINTIKLELEIKQLKERLNIAEKNIRETVESKKDSPLEMPKICSSTQIINATNDVGTQSNLFETKESDCCSEDNKIYKLEVLSQLQEKILKLENLQEKQCTGNQESINAITQKLSEITESLQSKSEQDTENLKKLAKDAILSNIPSNQTFPAASIDKFQEILSNTVSEVLNLNSEKLNAILNKIETIYAEKLPFLEVEIKRGNILAQEQIKEAISSTFTASALPSNIDDKFEDNDFSVLNSGRTYSIYKPEPILSNEAQSYGSSTDISQEILEFQQSDRESLPQSRHHSETELPIAALHKKVTKTLAKKVTSYGINSSAASLSASEAEKISARLAEHRNSLIKIYPRFYATRNKLKNIVARLSSKKAVDGQLHSDSLPEINKFVAKESYVGDSGKMKPKGNLPGTSSGKNESENEAFKKRLEKILSSPIKKPSIYIPNRMKEPMKPIPLPRKRVMFSNPDYGSTGDEVSLSQKDLKESKKNGQTKLLITNSVFTNKKEE